MMCPAYRNLPACAAGGDGDLHRIRLVGYHFIAFAFEDRRSEQGVQTVAMNDSKAASAADNTKSPFLRMKADALPLKRFSHIAGQDDVLRSSNPKFPA